MWSRQYCTATGGRSHMILVAAVSRTATTFHSAAAADFSFVFMPQPCCRRCLLSPTFRVKTATMSFSGTVQNGMVILPPELSLPDGAEVEVVLREAQPDDDPFLEAVSKAARPRPHWPKDYALNHGHYVSGEPRKSGVQSLRTRSSTSPF